jgi:hypothetical protein
MAYLATPCDPPIEEAGSCTDLCALLGPELQDVAVTCFESAVACELPSGCALPVD